MSLSNADIGLEVRKEFGPKMILVAVATESGELGEPSRLLYFCDGSQKLLVTATVKSVSIYTYHRNLKDSHGNEAT